MFVFVAAGVLLVGTLFLTVSVLLDAAPCFMAGASRVVLCVCFVSLLPFSLLLLFSLMFFRVYHCRCLFLLSICSPLAAVCLLLVAAASLAALALLLVAAAPSLLFVCGLLPLPVFILLLSSLSSVLLVLLPPSCLFLLAPRGGE